VLATVALFFISSSLFLCGYIKVNLVAAVQKAAFPQAGNTREVVTARDKQFSGKSD